MQIEPFLSTVLTDMQADQKIGKDTADISSDEDDDEVMAPFGGEEALQAVSQAPDPRVFAVDVLHVAGDDVFGTIEGGDVLTVGREEWV